MRHQPQRSWKVSRMDFQDWSSISLGGDVRTTRCGTRLRRVMIMDDVEDKVRMCFTTVLAREDAQSSCSDDTCARGFFPIGHRMKGPWNYGEGPLMHPFADARNFMTSERLDMPLVPVKRVPNAIPPYWGRKSARRTPPWISPRLYASCDFSSGPLSDIWWKAVRVSMSQVSAPQRLFMGGGSRRRFKICLDTASLR